MKYILVLTITFFSCAIMTLAAAPASKPKLTSPLIKFLDNKPFCLDCAAMGNVLHVRREARKIQYGIYDGKTKKFVGFYEFDGELRTLHWLAEYEKALTTEFTEQKDRIEKKYMDIYAFTTEWNVVKQRTAQECERKIQEQSDYIKRSFLDEDEYEYQITKMRREITIEHELLLEAKEDSIKLKHVKNKEGYQQALEILVTAYQIKMDMVKPCLQRAMHDFITATAPFVIQMQGTKQMTIKIIEEFCLKYKRPYSFLLGLADIEDDQVVPMFIKKMNTCQLLDKAITDLTDFLEALYYSCDKARAEFEAKERAKAQK